jgi:lipoprotein-releasing system permease protein
LYKLLLCWRYLKTRYLALACVISVMLGVATLIVVNSVMSGFSAKLRDRLHALLSDVVIEANSLEGFADPEGKMAKIRNHPELGTKVEGMTATMETWAMIHFRWPNGETMTKMIRLVGVDFQTRGQVGGFEEHLAKAGVKVVTDDWGLPKSEVVLGLRKEKGFELPEGVRQRYENLHHFRRALDKPVHSENPDAPPPPEPPPSQLQFKIPRGLIPGNLIACIRQNKGPQDKENDDLYVLKPGDEVKILTISGPLSRGREFDGEPRLAAVQDTFIVVDYFKSEMSEYDSNIVFVPLDYLQHLRTMQDRATSIQIKLRDYSEVKAVVKDLKDLFPIGTLRIETWEDKQGPLLAAISIEKGILNVLLFLIIAVAGFGILAIFSMIVAEKTRDIGILKALGASNGGVMKIFLGYGLLLGVVGSGLGTGLGLTFTHYINEIEQFLTQMTGTEIFDRRIYYFNEIPTHVPPMMVLLVNLGAVAIAVVFSILPALRAALLHPVRALRYE